MSPLAIELVRRLSWLTLAIAAALYLLPRVLGELGLWGPSPEDHIAAATRAVDTARAYGAREDEAAVQAASQELAQAARLLKQGDERAARRAAQRASGHAVEAQRVALTEHEAARRQAALIAMDIDRRLGDLEDLYARIEPGADEKTRAALGGVMKEARRQGAGVLLAVEERDYAKARREEAAARAVLESAQRKLESLARPR